MRFNSCFLNNLAKICEIYSLGYQVGQKITYSPDYSSDMPQENKQGNSKLFVAIFEEATI